jgi:hypothetical protein
MTPFGTVVLLGDQPVHHLWTPSWNGESKATTRLEDPEYLLDHPAIRCDMFEDLGTDHSIETVAAQWKRSCIPLDYLERGRISNSRHLLELLKGLSSSAEVLPA